MPIFSRLGALVTLCALLTACTARDAPHAVPAGRAVFPKDRTLGGFSGLEVSADGLSFTAISDGGRWVTGAFLRENGRLRGIAPQASQPLVGPDGRPLRDDQADAEGLAIAADGRVFVSLERDHRILADATTARAERLPLLTAFAGFQDNAGIEALAIDARGHLYTLPERSGRLTRPFPVWRYDGTWQQVFSISRSGGFQPTGADFGPDGRFYLLERAFSGISFRSRVRRFTLDGDRIVAEETLLLTAPHKHGNLEGLSVWRDGAGMIRLSMIADDNFNSFQRNEIVEYRVME